MVERKSFTNFPAGQPCVPDAQAHSCEEEGVDVSQHFHRLYKLTFLSQPFSKVGKKKDPKALLKL